MKIGCRNRITVLLAFAAFSSGCATSNLSYLTGQNEARAEVLATGNQFYDAAGVYIGLATRVTGPERDRLTLLAVEQWLLAGDGRRARNALSQVERPSNGELLWLWMADAAALLLWEGNHSGALSLLDPLTKETLPANHRARVDALLADSWFQKGEPLKAVHLYIRRESRLNDLNAINSGHIRLWAQLRVGDVQTLREAAEMADDPIARGWLALAAIANSTGQRGMGWRNGVARWQVANRNHPAGNILSDLSVPEDSLLNYPRQIALLLPLSGDNGAAGNAIKNGFLGAYFAAVDGIENRQIIRAYDVNVEGGVQRAYTQGMEEGADFFVGPLLRQNVAKLGSKEVLPVPVLSLNYLADGWMVPPGLYQFALSPEDEAAAVATRALDDHKFHAVTLVPANEWGRRVQTAFATQFEKIDGTILDYSNYEPLAQDFSFEIEALMGLSDSIERYQRLRTNVGQPLQFDPRRRQDIDFVFLAADSKVGRLIKSQLKFHYSGELPVYSTSFIFSMDGKSNSDLNGVMFADAPWVVAPPPWIADFPKAYGEYWPAERRLARLHAMGYDAYHLVGALFNARDGNIGEIPGATGHLFMHTDGRIHRRLAWAQFERGKPTPLPTRYERQRIFEELRPVNLKGTQFDR